MGSVITAVGVVAMSSGFSLVMSFSVFLARVLTVPRLLWRECRSDSLFHRFIAARTGVILVVLSIVSPAVSQTITYSRSTLGSVPSGPATTEVLKLTLRDAINMALRYNLGSIEIGENTRLARGQRLIAMSSLLPQVGGGATEGVYQETPLILRYMGEKLRLNTSAGVFGPYSGSIVGAELSQTVFSLPSIQRFRAARNTEQAAQLNYQDTLVSCL